MLQNIIGLCYIIYKKQVMTTRSAVQTQTCTVFEPKLLTVYVMNCENVRSESVDHVSVLKHVGVQPTTATWPTRRRTVLMASLTQQCL